eukprot:54336_1
MSSPGTVAIILSKTIMLSWNFIQLKIHIRCQLSPETTTTLYLQCVPIIVHCYCYSSALSISYAPGELKPILFSHNTTHLGLVATLKFTYQLNKNDNSSLRNGIYFINKFLSC